MAFRLGIDLGTSTTVAVLAGPASVRPLLFDASPLLSSAVFGGSRGPTASAVPGRAAGGASAARGDGGVGDGPATFPGAAGAGDGPGRATAELLTGLDAERAAIAQPAGLEANPKRRIDDGTVWLGEHDYPVAEVLAAILRRVADEGRRVAGEPIAEHVLTHPAAWGRTRIALLAEAAARAGLEGELGMVAEPVAAAAYFATVRDLPPDQCVVVYDLGAGTFDASVVRRTAAGFEVIAADGLVDVGGLDLDAAVVQHARGLTAGAGTAAAEAWGRLDWPQTPADLRARRALWAGARAAKEQLTRHATANLHVPLIDADLHVTRDEFERAARVHLDRTVALTVRVLRDAQVGPERIGGVFLVGGSSRIPLAATLLHRTLRVAPTIVDQPELVVAEGSLLAPVVRGLGRPAADQIPTVRVPPAPVRSGSNATAPVSAVPVSAVPVSAAPVPAAPVPAAPETVVAAAPVSPAAPKPPSPPRPPVLPVPSAGARRRRWSVLLLVVVLAAAAIVGFRLYQSSRGPIVAELKGHTGPVRSVAFSPDGKRLASVGDDGRLYLWDVAKRAATGGPIEIKGDKLTGVAWRPDGGAFAAVGSDQQLYIWPADKTAPERFKGQNRPDALTAVAYSSRGDMIAIGSDRGITVVYDTASGSQRAEFSPFNGAAVTGIAFSPVDNDLIVLGGDRPTIQRASVAGVRVPGVDSETHSGPITAVAYSPDGETIASGGQAGDVLLWPNDFAGVPATKLDGRHGGAVRAVAFDRASARLATAGEDKTIRLWGVSSHAAIGGPRTECPSPIRALAFSPTDTDLLASGSDDGIVRLWHLA